MHSFCVEFVNINSSTSLKRRLFRCQLSFERQELKRENELKRKRGFFCLLKPVVTFVKTLQ